MIKELLKNFKKTLPYLFLNFQKKIGITTTPCWNRIKKLEEEKIILSKTIILDNNKINLAITVFLSISIPNHTDKWLENFKKIVKQHDEITEVHRLTGSDSDYQITILASSIREYDIFQQRLIKEIECTKMSSHISLNTIKKSNKLSLKNI